jgi:leucyl/phenylalanyl-tRNA--protein transferase
MTATPLTPELLLRAYGLGLFPMAESAEASALQWIDPQRRGIIPLEGFHISRSLRHHLRTAAYQITLNADFSGVMRACAERPETWINAEIFSLYNILHVRGQAHSLEVWQDGALVGGVYGVALGGAFCGESMFSRRTNASKTALAWLVDRLHHGGFALFDTQFLTPHLASLGAVEIPREAYRKRLAQAMRLAATLTPAGYQPSASSVSSGVSSKAGMTPSGSVQPKTQTS